MKLRTGFRRSLVLVLCSGFVACAEEADEGPAGAAILARDRAAELFATADYGGARETLAPLLTGSDVSSEDLIRAATIEFADTQLEEVESLARRALELAPEDPAPHYLLYLTAQLEGRLEEQLAHIRRAHELAPDDYPTRLHLAKSLHDNELSAEAEEHYQALLAKGTNFGGGWMMTTLYSYSTLLRMSQRRTEADQQLERYRQLERAGLKSLSGNQVDLGNLARVAPHTQVGWRPARLPDAPDFEIVETISTGSTRGVAPAVWHIGFDKEQGYVSRSANDMADLFTFGENGVARLSRGASWESTQVFAGDVVGLIPCDLSVTDPGKPDPPRDGDLDACVFVRTGGRVELRFLEQVDGRLVAWDEPLLADTGGPAEGCVWDYDHDGDVDLCIRTVDGLRVLRNDGAGVEGGGFTDATAETGLPPGSFRPIPEDLDHDQDVDLLLVGDGTVRWASSERGGVFSDATDRLPGFVRGADDVLVADLDGDSRPDLAASRDGAWQLFTRTVEGGFRAGIELEAPADGVGRPLALDVDGDLSIDLVWASSSAGLAGLRAVGFPHRAAFSSGPAPDMAPNGLFSAASADGLELFVVGGDAVVRLVDSVRRQGIRLTLRGHKDTGRGPGATVEVRAGDGRDYRRIWWQGEPMWVGTDSSAAHVVRVTWPNGVVQTALDLAAGGDWLMRQRPGVIGSCPFLYTWNGSTYTFISDVLGITPLGLPMEPGLLVPPDHDEFVLVRGEELVPKDGSYELQLTEELREVTYLDAVRLHVIDHREGTEVFPEERFTFPPFPAHRVHTLRDPLVPERALGSDGRDWRNAVSADDWEFARPFRPLKGQFMGLATPHHLELEFDSEAVASADRLRLVMKGWFYWTDASVNVAAARHPEVEFVPPMLSVPDGASGWRVVGPLGFPAGKLKTMVVDVTEMLEGQARLRISSTLELYWDSIRLAIDADEATIVETRLEPVAGDLWERGFSEPVTLLHDAHLHWFEWDGIATQPRWDMHPGLYTRFGDVLPLLGSIDDRFVIMGSGDALTLRFDAREVPALKPGWQRDFLVFLDGWAKDGDPNTLEAQEVEPLPFHGMSAYPYGPDEHFPDDEAHRAWRAEWNTRPAKRWIAPLSPRWDQGRHLTARHEAQAHE